MLYVAAPSSRTTVWLLPSISIITVPVSLFFIVTLIVELAPTITCVAPMDNISLSAFVTVNTFVVVAGLWVSLPSNVAVTVYVPAVMPVILFVALPLTVNVKL